MSAQEVRARQVGVEDVEKGFEGGVKVERGDGVGELGCVGVGRGVGEERVGELGGEVGVEVFECWR